MSYLFLTSAFEKILVIASVLNQTSPQFFTVAFKLVRRRPAFVRRIKVSLVSLIFETKFGLQKSDTVD